MWGRKRGDASKSTKTPSAGATSDPAPASILTPAKSRTEDAQKQTAEITGSDIKESATIKLAHLESELQSRTEEVDDLSSNLSLAKESLR